MKKSIWTIKNIMLTMAIILFFSVPVSFADAEMNNTIKIGIKYSETADYSYTLKSESGFHVGKLSAEGTFTALHYITDYTNITAANKNGYISVMNPAGDVLIDNIEDNVILPADYPNGIIEFENVQYRGGFLFLANSLGTLNAINVLNIDQYVYGVLNSEMRYENPIEALKAQAVTARSFAAANEGRHKEQGFDLCTGTHCQVYKGYSDEYEETNMAADLTSGLCLYFQGRPVSAYYFKNSGGHTQNIKDVWGSEAGYLKGVKDIYSPEYPWTAEFTFSEIEEKLKSAGEDVGFITKVEIAKNRESGVVKALEFTGTKGSVSYSKEKVRSFFGLSVVKSTIFSIENGQIIYDDNENDQPKTVGKAADYIYTTNGAEVRALESRVYTIGAEGVLTEIPASEVYMTDGRTVLSQSGESEDESAAGEQIDREYITSGPLILKGRGYGHGIGMPQDSAIEMAKQGFTFDTILKYYYTDIEIGAFTDAY